MIREISSYRFPGFYESIFCYSDEFVDEEHQLACDFGIDPNHIYFEYIDFGKYKLDVSSEYMALYVEAIIDVLPDNIKDNKDFKFELVDKKCVAVISPQYYNYDTDHCYCDVDTNETTLKLIKDYTLSLEGVEEYIAKHFISRDGFISFISNDFEYWKSLDVVEYEENMLIALLDMLLSLSDDEIFNNIAYETEEKVSRYEYATAIVNHNGKEYDLYDFIALKEKEVV